MPDENEPSPPAGQVLIYHDGATRLQVRLEGRSAWLTQRLMAELYQVSVPTISEHLASIYADGELGREATIRSFRIVQREGARDVARQVEHYNLDAILAVGYRVRSARGTVFRQWATAQLRDLLVKGFVLDDERLKAGRTIGADYFDELLERTVHVYVGKTGDNRDGCNPVISRAGNHFSFNVVHSQMRNKLPGKPEEWDFDFFYATFGCYRDPAESREGVNTINEMERSLNRLAQEAFGDHLMNPLKGYVTRHRRLQRAAFVTPEREAVLLEVVGAAKESISQGTKPPAKKGGRS